MNPCPRQLNFAQYLSEINATRAAKAAYMDGERTLSYGALAERSARFAGLLQELGLRREERALLLMHDTVDWPVAFLGALHAGIVPVAVNTLLTPDDYAYMLAHSRSQAVFVSGTLLPVLREALQRGKHEVRHIIVSEPTEALQAPCIDFESRVLAAPPVPATDTCADEIAFWLYSSGSTGQPKGVVHSHGNLWYTVELYGKPVLGVRESDVVFSAAKLFFAYGLGNALSFPLAVGATVVLLRGRPTPQAVFDKLVEFQPTVFCGVPTLYASMLASPDLPMKEQVSMRVCTSAGEASGCASRTSGKRRSMNDARRSANALTASVPPVSARKRIASVARSSYCWSKESRPRSVSANTFAGRPRPREPTGRGSRASTAPSASSWSRWRRTAAGVSSRRSASAAAVDGPLTRIDRATR